MGAGSSHDLAGAGYSNLIAFRNNSTAMLAMLRCKLLRGADPTSTSPRLTAAPNPTIVSLRRMGAATPERGAAVDATARLERQRHVDGLVPDQALVADLDPQGVEKDHRVDRIERQFCHSRTSS